MDAGNTLLTNPLKFLQGRGYLLPHVQHRRGNTINEMAPAVTHAVPAAHDDVWGQSARFVPFQYSSSLPEGIAAEPDPFYSVLDLFEFAASSERQYLNMLSSQIKAQVKASSTSVKTAITVLQAIAVSLQEHTERLKQNVMTIKDRGGPQWPRTQHEYRGLLDHAVNSTLRDYEALLDDAVALSGHCKVAMSIVMSIASIEDTKRSTQLSQSVLIFTITTVFFLPLTFMSSVFGMNMSQFEAGSFDIRLWFLIAISFLVFVLATVYFFSNTQSLRDWVDALLLRHPRQDSFIIRMLRRCVARSRR